MSELYGIDITIKNNVPEVKAGLEEIKKILDTINTTKYAINVDSSSLKSLKSTIDSITTSLANNFSQTATSTTKFITDMNKSLSQSLKGLQGKTGYEKEIQEIKTLQNTLQNYASSRTKLTADEMTQIQNVSNAMSNLSKAATDTSNSQVAGSEKVSNAYSKLANLIKQIDNIKNNSSKYITKTGADPSGIQSTINSLDSYKDKIIQLMSDQTRLGNLTIEEYQKIVLAINGAKNAVSQFQTANDASTKLVSGVEKQTQAVNKLEEAHKKLASNLKLATSQQKQEYEALGRTIANLKTSLANVNNASDLSKVTNQVKTVDNSLKNLKTSINENVTAMSGMNNILSRSMSYFTGRLMYEASAFITRGIRDMVTSTLEMNSAMTEMSMVTSKSMSTMREEFREYNALAKELKVSTMDVANAMIEFARQGLNTETSMSRVAVTTQFAKAAAIDFTMAAELLTAGFNSLGNGVEDNFLFLSDVLLEIGRKAGTSAEEIATAMQKSASLASQNGVELEELAAMLGTVSEQTRTSAETIGTSFASMMSRFGNMTFTGFDEEGNSINYVANALKKVNIQIKDDDGWKSYSQILKEVGVIWQDLKKDVESGGDAAKIAEDKMNLLATQLAGTRQKNAFISLMDNFDRYLELVDVAEGAAGTTEQSYASYLNSTEAAINSFKASWESLKLSFSESGFLDNVINASAQMLELFTKTPAQGVLIVASVMGISKAVLTMGQNWKTATMAQIQANSAVSTTAKTTTIVQGLGAAFNKTTLATVGTTMAVTALNVVISACFMGAIALVSSFVFKLLDAESASRQLSESMLELKNSKDEVSSVAMLSEYVEKCNDINTSTEERLRLEENIANIKSELSDSDNEYKNIIDNENLSLETQVSLLEIIAKNKREEAALDAKENYLKEQRALGTEAQIIKLQKFNDLYKQREELVTKINEIESQPWDNDYKAFKLQEIVQELANVETQMEKVGASIISTNSEAEVINASLGKSELKLQTLDNTTLTRVTGALSKIGEVTGGSKKSILETASSLDTLTTSTEQYITATEKAEQVTKNFNDVFGGAADKSDFLQDIMDEYEEYGSLSYDTINEMVNNHSDLLYLLEDEGNFMVKAAEAQVKAEKDAALAYDELVGAIRDGTIEIEEYINKPYESIIEGTGKVEGEATPAIENFTNTSSANMESFANNTETSVNRILRSMATLRENAMIPITYNIQTVTSQKTTAAPTGSSTGSNTGGEAGVTSRTSDGINTINSDTSPSAHTEGTMFDNTTTTRGAVSIRPNYPSSGGSSSSSSSSTSKKPSSSSSSSKANSSSTKSTVEDLELTIEKFFTLNQQIDNVNNAIERYEILSENANPKQRLAYMQKEITLYNQKKELLIDLYNAQQKELASMKKKLTAQGFIIDNQGTIKNYETQLNKIQANANKLSSTAKENAKEKAEKIADLVKEFQSLNNELQSTNNSIAEMENTIYSALKEQVQLISDMESKISEILRKQIEERKQMIEDEKNAKIDAINAEKVNVASYVQKCA